MPISEVIVLEYGYRVWILWNTCNILLSLFSSPPVSMFITKKEKKRKKKIYLQPPFKRVKNPLMSFVSSEHLNLVFSPETVNLNIVIKLLLCSVAYIWIRSVDWRCCCNFQKIVIRCNIFLFNWSFPILYYFFVELFICSHTGIVCKQMCDLPDEVQKRQPANKIAMQACLPQGMHHQMA